MGNDWKVRVFLSEDHEITTIQEVVGRDSLEAEEEALYICEGYGLNTYGTEVIYDQS